jgi:transcriptional regulator GlxA family with amidase domain
VAENLAEAAHLSPRKFTRAFPPETGQSPAKTVENPKVEAVRLMLEQGRRSPEVIACEIYFADHQWMHRAPLLVPAIAAADAAY